MKYKRVVFSSGAVITSEHLVQMLDYSNQWVLSLHKICGIYSLDINYSLLNTGLLSINKIECIFPDGTYINYDQNNFNTVDKYGNKTNKIYKLEFNLQNIADKLSKPCRLYIYPSTTDTNISSAEISRNATNSVYLEYEEPKLCIIDSDNYKQHMYGIPIIEVVANNGMYDKTNYIPPYIYLNSNSEVFDILKDLRIFLNHNYISNREEEKVEKKNNEKIIQLLCEAIIKIDKIIINNVKMKEVYDVMVEIIGKFAYKFSEYIPIIPRYEENEIIKIISETNSIIYNLLYNSGANYKKSEFKKKDDNTFSIKLEDIKTEKLLVSIDENSIESKVWFEQSRIASASVLDYIENSRLQGAKRILFNDSISLMYKIDLGRFIKSNDELIIFNTNKAPFNAITLYLQ